MSQTYTTTQGEYWDEVAKRLGWAETDLALLLEANPTHAGTVRFAAGVVLTIPDRNDEPNTTEILPAWKRA